MVNRRDAKVAKFLRGKERRWGGVGVMGKRGGPANSAFSGTRLRMLMVGVGGEVHPCATLREGDSMRS
jgi:hypothetical protein